MKKLLVLLPALMIFAGCASSPTMGTRYTLDANQNIVEEQYIVSTGSESDKYWKTALIIAGGFAGLYVLGEAFDVWDDDPAPAAAPVVPNNGLIAASGGQFQASGFQTNYIQPTYVPVQ